jgi:hypothetical protein
VQHFVDALSFDENPVEYLLNRFPESGLKPEVRSGLGSVFKCSNASAGATGHLFKHLVPFHPHSSCKQVLGLRGMRIPCCMGLTDTLCLV